jgi:Uma2 family endonuclease
VRAQLPLALSDYDEPFPDLAVVSGSPRDYLAQHPTSALLVVEVSEASLKTDREVKGSLYASAGIPEYWILNLRERVLEVYREPAADARAVYGAAYRQQQHLSQQASQCRPSVRPTQPLRWSNCCHSGQPNGRNRPAPCEMSDRVRRCVSGWCSLG